MRQSYDFNDLFVFEMANNHQGDVEHGLKIIREMGAAAAEYGVRAAIKFQFRQLDTFIHPDYREASEPKHIQRFLSTELSRDEFQTMFDAARAQNLLTMCTPFDEASVDVIEEMGFDIIKVASASCQDWPLLERISEANLPVIVSTGGQDIAAIDNISSFCHHRGIDHALMHCVALYPTPDAHCQLNQIDRLRERYRDTTIGWSTHEDPGDTDVVIAAYAKGARMFEKHVGVVDGPVTQLNAYSADPDQVRAWLAAYKKAVALCGDDTRETRHTQAERDALAALQRGVYAREPLAPGQQLTMDDVFFAMPLQHGQLTSGRFKPGTTVKQAVESNGAVAFSNVDIPSDPDRKVIQSSLHKIKAMLNEARIPLNSDFKVEYSHHHGVENFREVGAVLIDVVNRKYCKKIVAQLPGQYHPAHFHKLKDETFIIVHGTLHLEVDGHHKVLSPGETAVVQPGVWHHFWTETGVIFEEISSTHKNDDSFYKDKRINRMPRSARKTIVDHWGRFTLRDEDEAESEIWPPQRRASQDEASAEAEPNSVIDG
ncbi:D-lyxose/D-mannose family sugar isomerase [Salinisphaera hydrothermalis]|uniref:D-lyxose/D-mannose family sugar isomerase n=1 Tax=Salinisphaera hydrothermalis TaxID=563188 RepID=UPI00333EB4ED